MNNFRLFSPMSFNSAFCWSAKKISVSVSSFLVCFCVVTATGGCGGNEPPQPEPEPPAKELSASSSQAVSTPQGELFETAKGYFASQLYSLAEESFTALRDSYPQGPYLQFAEIKLADIAFLSNDFDVAAQRYQEFVQSHPASPSAPYALYRAARSSQLSTRGVGRDITPVQKAVEQYKELSERYADSPYAQIGEKARLEAQKMVVAHERYVQNFYEEQEQYDAAEARAASFREEKKKYVQHALVIEKNEQRREARKGSANLKKLPRPRLVVAARSKDKKVVDVSGDSLRAMLTEYEVKDSFKADRLTVPEGLVTIERVSCHSEGERKFVFIHLSKELNDQKFIKDHLILLSRSGVLSLKLPQATSEPRSVDCFDPSDLIISSNGIVTVRGVQRAELLELNNPPRLVLMAF
jgi:outer membrane protein assembly factor BamD